MRESERQPVLNRSTHHRDDPTPSRGNQLTRAVSLILASLGFVHDFRTGQLEPDSFRGIPRECGDQVEEI